MLYTYTVYTFGVGEQEGQPVRTDTTTRLEEIETKDVTSPYWVEIWDNSKNCIVTVLTSEDELESWQTSQERAHAWASPKRNSSNTAVAPKHYESFVDDYQWLDVMSRIHRYQNPEAFKGAVELQIRKYLDRNGRKDAELQELMKGLFYYIYLIKYIKNDEKPIFAKDVHKIMDSL